MPLYPLLPGRPWLEWIARPLVAVVVVFLLFAFARGERA